MRKKVHGLMVLSVPRRVADVDRQAVLAAVGGPGDGEVVDHLREGERDHDEVDAAGAEAEGADREGDEAGGDDGGRAR